MNRFSRLALLAPVLALAACVSVKAYRHADELTYAVLGEEYIAYLKADTVIDATEKTKRLEACAKWKARIDERAAIDKAEELACYNLVAPEYVKYVESDPKLTAEQKARYKRTAATWKLRIDKGAP